MFRSILTAGLRSKLGRALSAMALMVTVIATPSGQVAAYPWDPSVYVHGPISCWKGAVVGGWYRTGTGEQGWASIFTKNGVPWYSVQLRQVPTYTTTFSINIGCGGTSSRWGTTVRASTMVWRPKLTNWFPQGMMCYQQGTNVQATLTSNNVSISCNQYV